MKEQAKRFWRAALSLFESIPMWVWLLVITLQVVHYLSRGDLGSCWTYLQGIVVGGWYLELHEQLIGRFDRGLKNLYPDTRRWKVALAFLAFVWLPLFVVTISYGVLLATGLMGFVLLLLQRTPANQPTVEAAPCSASKETPSVVADFLAYSFLPKEHRDCILGDLREEYETEILLKFGKAGAKLWYWLRVADAIVPIRWTRLIDTIIRLSALCDAAESIWEFVKRLKS